MKKQEAQSVKSKLIPKKAGFWLAFPASLIPKNRLVSWLIYLLLSLLFVTFGIPAIANQLNSPAISPIVQQLTQPSELLQQGKDYYQSGQLSQAIDFWEKARKAYQNQGEVVGQIQALNYLALANQDIGKIETAQATISQSINLLNSVKGSTQQHRLLLAQALNTQGTIQLLQGKTETALVTWRQAAAIYEQTGDRTGKLISQINQAQALQTLGQYRQAKSLLEQLVRELQTQPDTLLKAQGLRSLGVALQTSGDLIQSKTILEQSWALSQKLNSPADRSAALFSIGNVARDLQQYDVAWQYYQEAVNLSVSKQTKIDAQLNQLSMLVNLAKWEPALALISTIENDLSDLPATRPSIYAKINLAESLIKIEESPAIKSEFKEANGLKIVQLLVTAIQEAKKIQDPRAEAYSLYQLSKIYQFKNQLNEAIALNKQALQIAQEIKADDIIARSAGQLGAILKQQSEVKEAIAAYEIAFNNLQSLRSDLVAINPEVQFSFKEEIEPIYRDLVSLLLTPVQGEVSQANLKQARQVMEALQIAELDNFFQDACLDSNPVAIDRIDVQAAVIYPIVLPDRLEVILAIPNQPLRHYTTQLAQQQVETILKQFYSSLSPGYPNNERLQLAQQIYNWLIAPATTNLENNQIQTLVFVPDGFLRNLPMAALYNGKKYLLEDYNIVLSPGLQLFPQRLTQKKLTLLAAGLTEARQGFQPLPGVYTEIEEITSEIKAEVLLNEKFTFDKFKKTIDNEAFPIIHLATHGQFSSNPEETFLLTWSDLISISEFDLLFQRRRLGLLEPIELLVLSACQTAAGDNRATLGLAGFALRSGAKSTIASLWSVNDESTSNLMQELYQQLSTGKVNKAEALRQAQLKLITNPLYKHPYFWSAFVLVGNWL